MAFEFLEILHIGGHNPILRKQTDKVIDAFMSVTEKREDVKMTVTTIGKIPDKYNNIGNRNLSIIRGELSESEIQDLYLKCHYVIQVPTHEGLGLDFYEAIKYCKPVVTLDAPPNNELINISNGWLLKCNSIANIDNAYGITKSYMFKTHDLAQLIEQITLNQAKAKSNFIKQIEINKNNEDYLQELFYALNSNSRRMKNKATPESISVKRSGRFLRFIYAIAYILGKKNYLDHYIDLRRKIKNTILKIERLWL